MLIVFSLSLSGLVNFQVWKSFSNMFLVTCASCVVLLHGKDSTKKEILKVCNIFANLNKLKLLE